jgi:hypothetical protein
VRGKLLLTTIKTGDLIAELDLNAREELVCAFSPDGRRILVKGKDNWIVVCDIEELFALFFPCAGLPIPIAQDRTGRSIAVGGSLGIIQILTLAGVKFGPPVITPVRLWVYTSRWWHSITNRKPQADWAKEITFGCNWCGSRLQTPAGILDAIGGVSRDAKLSDDQSPCTELPAEAWEERRLLSDCPHCRQPLRFNPFVVDNRERY